MMTTTNLLVMSSICLYLTIFLMTSRTLAFMSLLPKSKTHQDITRDAVLQATANVCRLQAAQEGKKFVLPDPLTVTSLAEACFSPDSAKDFQSTINEINKHNAMIDVQHQFTGSYHFDNEEFWSGRDLITEGVSAVKSHVMQQRYQPAREALGKVLHTLQDFYSHSNWIELGNRVPYSNLIKPNTLISNIAESATCRSCYGDGCPGNILETVITQQKLTSGYYGQSKPKGKCSHGGNADLSSWGEGGINKDSTTSSHGYLHDVAALVATNATAGLLDDIRLAVGNSTFLRLVGLGHTSALCFVIDTTDYKPEDIGKLRGVTSSIIDSKKGNAIQPLEYILVTFNGTDYGILTRTSDPKVFKDEINALVPYDGGHDPKLYLTGLKLALTGSPPQTEIFVFINADAKDEILKSTVRGLIERTKSVVTFMLLSSSQPSQDYQDLAEASGGNVIEVNTTEVSNIIALTSRPSLVTLYQARRNPGKADNFSVFVDYSVKSLTLYFTGNFIECNITSPTGATKTMGPNQQFFDLDTVQPDGSELAGQWLFNITHISSQNYTFKVVGQSMIDFLFDIVELSQGLHTSYVVLQSRPIANTSLDLLLSMVAGDNVRPTAVSLVNPSGSNSFKGKLNEIGAGQYLVSFNSIPKEEFTVRVDGEASFLSDVSLKFQRQSSTHFQTSNVIITIPPVDTIEPGTQFTLPFTVTTKGSGGKYYITVSNNHNSSMYLNESITLESGDSVNGTVFMTVNTTSGTEVTVTIQAEAADGSDFNYAVRRLLVVSPTADLFPPVCETISINADCPGDCSQSSWNLIAKLFFGYGSSIPSVRVFQGNGNLNTTTELSDLGVIVTTIVYSSSCCYKELELVAVDEIGNVVTCFKSLRATAPPSILTYGAEFFLILPVCLWLNILLRPEV